MTHWIIAPVILPAILAPFIILAARYHLGIQRVFSIAGVIGLIAVATGLAWQASDGSVMLYQLGGWAAPFGGRGLGQRHGRGSGWVCLTHRDRTAGRRLAGHRRQRPGHPCGPPSEIQGSLGLGSDPDHPPCRGQVQRQGLSHGGGPPWCGGIRGQRPVGGIGGGGRPGQKPVGAIVRLEIDDFSSACLKT
mgnify:CR=1 FL=1